MADIMELSGAEFEELVLAAEGPVLISFEAPWCGPCVRFAPVLEAVADALAERLRVLKVNTDENPELARTLGVEGIPTSILFIGGRQAGRFVGVMEKNELQRRLEEALGRWNA